MTKVRRVSTGKASSAGASSKLVWANAGVLCAIMACAFSVIQTSHACRQLYAQLQILEAAQWYMQEDFGRLLLEQSTWASHYRVEQVATRDLGMRPPTIADLRVFAP